MREFLNCHKFSTRAEDTKMLIGYARVSRVRPELVAEVKYLSWTDDNLLRQVVYKGLREDKPRLR
jgi:ATP-dependent DNA ligase